jgi:alginate O-acetyltransferase complex protein AlgI
MFPQLIAGPIVRYGDISKSLSNRKTTLEGFAGGIIRFVCGLAKKVVLADYCGQIAEQLLSARSLSTLGTWFGVFAFTFQIYFDFSGYSDMAVGLGKMFGFDFCENFNYPYISRSVTEFWRRWLISIGTFFRDYVYIPLGGNKRLQFRNIAVVWLLTGFWHGASWNFVLWGCYFGALLIIEKYALFKLKLKPPSVLRWLYAFFIAMVGWAVFYYTDMSRMADALTAMFTWRAEESFRVVATVKESLSFMALCLLASTPVAKKLYEIAAGAAVRRGGAAAAAVERGAAVVYVGSLLFVCSVVLIGSSFSPFLYYRF